jgi:phospholipase/carboxylesterase
MTDPSPAENAPFGEALGEVGAAVLRSLHGLELTFRHLHPPEIPRLRDGARRLLEELEPALSRFREVSPPPGAGPMQEGLAAGAAQVAAALESFLEEDPAGGGVAGILSAMHLHAHAQEALYPLSTILPPVARFFAEPAWHERLETLERRESAPGEPSVGMHCAAAPEGGERERFTLYVPEWIDPGVPRPLIVALHGGSGSGREFLWTWLREARSRGCLLLAPSSRGSTWSLQAPPLDGAQLRAMVEYVCEQWTVDPERVLLTGLSDGATFTLLAGLSENAPYTHLAPVSGVLHPLHFALGNPVRAAGKPIYLVHGALDWMFPVTLARAARDSLEEAGAQLVYREIENLSHTYPREENDRILQWLDPALAPPA